MRLQILELNRQLFSLADAYVCCHLVLYKKRSAEKCDTNTEYIYLFYTFLAKT